ncbi:hypothetical protein JCM19239_2729 [Vibrio variabilis]|uniref:Uncharacterized protein n=1 Tax=Vibrio variabilis TaxID=990271 RepID=A0ABQ0JQL4_9VIBR|nr:hypothetical protein JCM19239_2729 [Vibrio variabilis]
MKEKFVQRLVTQINLMLVSCFLNTSWDKGELEFDSTTRL